MPLSPSGLQSDLETLFSEAPQTAMGCAQAWADAMGSYAAGVVPPSTTVSAASSALVAPLQAAFSSAAAAPGFDAAMLAFATSVAGGMAPTFTGVPPPAPLGIATMLVTMRDTHAAAAADFASHIHTWMLTGTAILVAPPFTVLTWT